MNCKLRVTWLLSQATEFDSDVELMYATGSDEKGEWNGYEIGSFINLSDGCTNLWLRSVSETGTFDKVEELEEVTDTRGNYIPDSWVVATHSEAEPIVEPDIDTDDDNGGTGRMLTGWQWIKGRDGVTRCYLLNPVSDNTLGACFIGPGVTPDGYEVDANGAWIER